MKTSLAAAFLCAQLFAMPAVNADDFSRAPRSFPFAGGKAVPSDFETVDLKYEFDVSARKTTGYARISLRTNENGYPFFDMIPAATSVSVNGEALNASDLVVVSDPDAVTRIAVLKKELPANQNHVVELTFAPNSGITYSANAVAAGFFMSDLNTSGRGFWEQYGPANLEFDAYKQTVEVEVVGIQTPHTLYVNGDVAELGDNHWQVSYPDYYSTSSFYFHLVAKGRFFERAGIFQGLNGNTPVRAYASTADLAARGLAAALNVMSENEGVYGPFAHAQALAYITPDGGGMEHAGATMTSLWALEHEFTHFWFARGVMPANGSSGWIDEAIASWRDDGYQRISGFPSSVQNLSGFSQYRRHTTQAAYTYGNRMIAGFDHMFREVVSGGLSGMRHLLRDLFGQYARQRITVQDFEAFLEVKTGRDLGSIFNRYIYARTTDEITLPPVVDSTLKGFSLGGISHHPRPYTQEELELYR